MFQTFLGCLVDTASGDVIDAGMVQIAPTGHTLVGHGKRPDGSEHSSPYLPNANHAVLPGGSTLN